MHDLRASIIKEGLLLKRDLGGLSILFIMPVLLVICISLVQDSTFKSMNETEISLLLVNDDNGPISEALLHQLTESGPFQIESGSTREAALESVRRGDYQVSLFIPEGLSEKTQSQVLSSVGGLMVEMELAEAGDYPQVNPENRLELSFDPTSHPSFRAAVESGLRQMLLKVETDELYGALRNELGIESENEPIAMSGFIEVVASDPIADEIGSSMNSTQHNIPAWTLFAIFFIIVPLSINIVREKNQGTFIRLRSTPLSFWKVLLAKALVYLLVSLAQFSLILLIGIYLFPVLGLPSLDVSGILFNLYLAALFSGLAAIGLGLLIGTLAQSHEQAAPMGATLVIILSALGGILIPVFAMPELMQGLALFSPMNWGLEAFQGSILRKAPLLEILPHLSALFLFFAATSAIAVYYYEKKIAV